MWVGWLKLYKEQRKRERLGRNKKELKKKKKIRLYWKRPRKI
jgi:hypothetical protein